MKRNEYRTGAQLYEMYLNNGILKSNNEVKMFILLL